MHQDDAVKLILVKSIDEFDHERFSGTERSEALQFAKSGEGISDPQRMVERARHLCRHLTSSPYEDALARARGLSSSSVSILVGLALFGGLFANYLGPTGKIHVLFNPITFLVVWTWSIFLIRSCSFFRGGGSSSAHLARLRVQEAPVRLARWIENRPDNGALNPTEWQALKTFQVDWEGASREIDRVRGRTWMDGLAVVFLLGSILGIFFQGVVRRYEVVYGSTWEWFNDPGFVTELIKFMTWPYTGNALLLKDVPGLMEGGAAAQPWLFFFLYLAVVFVGAPRAFLFLSGRAKLFRQERNVQFELDGSYVSKSLYPEEKIQVLGLLGIDRENMSLLISYMNLMVEQDILHTDSGRQKRRKKRWQEKWRQQTLAELEKSYGKDACACWPSNSKKIDTAIRSAKRSRKYLRGALLLEAAIFKPEYEEQRRTSRILSSSKAKLSGEIQSQVLSQFAKDLQISPGIARELSSDLETVLKALRPRAWGKIATAALVGAAAIGATAGLGAPLIGGAVGSLLGLSGAAAVNAGLATIGFGSLAAGGLGMAGGTAIVIGGGSLLGLGSGAVLAQKITNVNVEKATLDAAKLEVVVKHFRSDIDSEEQQELLNSLDELVKAAELAVRAASEEDAKRLTDFAEVLKRSDRRIRGLMGC